MTRPALRYHGGKWRIAPWVIRHFPPHTCYVEPFGGAASVLLLKEPVRIEVYNDRDGDVVELFRILRDPVSALELQRLLRLTPFARDEFLDAYEPSDDPIERVRRLIVRSFQGVGSNAIQARTRSGWRLRTPFSLRSAYASDWMHWPDGIPELCDRLRMVQVENRDFRALWPIFDGPETLWYLDPPYPSGTRSRQHRSVYKHELTDDDHRELCAQARAAVGMVALSSYASPIYNEALEGWTQVQRASLAQTNGKRTEVLWLSPRLVSRLQPQLLELGDHL